MKAYNSPTSRCLRTAACLLWIASCATAEQQGNVHTAAEMAFIEVDPGQTTALQCRATGQPFVAVGFNYFSPHVGWAPKLWQQFDTGVVREHLALARAQGFNTIRIFLTLESFHQQPGEVSAAGVAKFRELLGICRELGIYVIPSGPDHWEGTPAWRRNKDPFADEDVLQADERWWESFTRLFRDDPVILAWDLLNEPSVRWSSPAMQTRWNAWLREKYDTHAEIAAAHRRDPQQLGPPGQIPTPSPVPSEDDAQLYDYQLFRESLADTWTRRLVAAIHRGDSQHLVTVGHIQWASPVYLPGLQHYAAFNLRDNARHVDFITIHFYPLAPPHPGSGPQGIEVNVAYLEAVLSECSVGKPVMLGEFAWYGGGEIRNGAQVVMPAQSVDDQVAWCERLLQASRGRVCGWLHWAFADTPSSRDLTRWSGIWTADLTLKPWGSVYSAFARESTQSGATLRPHTVPILDDAARRAAITHPAPQFVVPLLR